MKRYLRVLLSACFLLLMATSLSGCGDKATESHKTEEAIDPKIKDVLGELPGDIAEYDKTVLEASQGADSRSVLTYYHKGDIVRYQTAQNILYFKELPAGKTESEYDELMKQTSTLYKDIEGLHEDYKKLDDCFVEWLIVDFEKIDREKAKDTLGIVLEGEGSISLSKSMEAMKQAGYQEK